MEVINPFVVKPLVKVTTPVKPLVPVTAKVPSTVVLGCSVTAVAVLAPIIIVPDVALSNALVALLA